MFNRTPPSGPPSLEEGPAPEEPMPYPGRDYAERPERLMMDQNALSIYGRPPVERSGDVVLPRAITDGPVIPQIPKADKQSAIRRRKSMLDDLELSAEEMLGADYFDSIRRSDNPRKPQAPSLDIESTGSRSRKNR